MATITGFTAERMLAIEGASVVDGEIVSGNLILTKHDGTPINAGPVIGPVGPQGPQGPPAISSIPGEVKLWPGSALPGTTYGRWVWADGSVYPVAGSPIAAGHIAAQWRTFGGASDPGGANFRVPDLRGLVPAGLDAMPGGARANRMARAVAITLAGRTGEETHVITVPEMPSHTHNIDPNASKFATWGSDTPSDPTHDGGGQDRHFITGVTAGAAGGNGAHENVQPTVFVPYIVFLDG